VTLDTSVREIDNSSPEFRMTLSHDDIPEPPHIEDELREAGLKATPQRLAILGCLEGDESHPTAQELYERVRAEHPTMAFATVYNTLSALTGIGRVRSLTLGGPTRFDPNTASHDHAICDGCGSITDVAARSRRGPAPDGLAGFSINRVERIYRGQCAECANERNV